MAKARETLILQWLRASAVLLILSACGSLAEVEEAGSGDDSIPIQLERDRVMIVLDRDAMTQSGLASVSEARDTILANLFGTSGYAIGSAEAAGGRPVLGRTFPTSASFSMQLSAEEVARIEEHPLVERCEPDRISLPQ